MGEVKEKKHRSRWHVTHPAAQTCSGIFTKSRHLLGRGPAPQAQPQKAQRSGGKAGSILSELPGWGSVPACKSRSIMEDPGWSPAKAVRRTSAAGSLARAQARSHSTSTDLQDTQWARAYSHTHAHTHSHTRWPGPPAGAPPPAALQGGVSSSAYCSRPSARPAAAPPDPRRRCGRAPGGGGGGQRGRDGAGVVAAARAGPQPLRHRPGRNHLRSSLLAPRPSPVLRQAGGAAGTRLRSSRLSPGLPRAAPTLRPPRQATLRQSRSHLLRVPGRG